MASPPRSPESRIPRTPEARSAVEDHAFETPNAVIGTESPTLNFAISNVVQEASAQLSTLSMTRHTRVESDSFQFDLPILRPPLLEDPDPQYKLHTAHALLGATRAERDALEEEKRSWFEEERKEMGFPPRGHPAMTVITLADLSPREVMMLTPAVWQDLVLAPDRPINDEIRTLRERIQARIDAEDAADETGDMVESDAPGAEDAADAPVAMDAADAPVAEEPVAMDAADAPVAMDAADAPVDMDAADAPVAMVEADEPGALVEADAPGAMDATFKPSSDDKVAASVASSESDNASWEDIMRCRSLSSSQRP